MTKSGEIVGITTIIYKQHISKFESLFSMTKSSHVFIGLIN